MSTVSSRRLSQLGVEEGLNLKNLASMEYINRRRQLLREAHREDPSKPTFEGAQYYMGDEDVSSGVYLAPSLKAHVASEMAKEAAIEKERRKAREARAGKGGAPKKT